MNHLKDFDDDQSEKPNDFKLSFDPTLDEAASILSKIDQLDDRLFEFRAKVATGQPGAQELKQKSADVLNRLNVAINEFFELTKS